MMRDHSRKIVLGTATILAVCVCVFDGVLFLKVLFRCSPATICRLKCVGVRGGPGKELRRDMITEVADVNGGAWEEGGGRGSLALSNGGGTS